MDRSHLATAALLVCAASCATLSPIARGACGNSVVEAGEDCDTFAGESGTRCGEAGTPSACRFECAPDPSGARPSCPPSWGCGLDGLCRHASGNFATTLLPIPAGASRLMMGDFDGDGRADVVGIGRPGADGTSKVRFHYFGDKGTLEHTYALPLPIAFPTVARLNDDDRDDLLFAHEGIGVFLGQADRTFLPVASAKVTIPFPKARLLLPRGVDGQLIQMVVYLNLAGHSALYPVDDLGNRGEPIAVDWAPDLIAGDVGIANVFDDPAASPCDDIVLAPTGESFVEGFSPCKQGDLAASAPWDTSPTRVRVELPDGARVDAGVRIVDVDADGHLDIIIGASKRAYVAYGTGRGFASKPATSRDAIAGQASPFRLKSTTADGRVSSTDAPFPLAGGDVNGDGLADFVFSDGLLVSVLGPNGAQSYQQAFHRDRGWWTEAVIADFNGNGKLDIAAASANALDIEFFNGTGTGSFASSLLSTQGTVSHLAIGDFDGDLISDLGFVDHSASGIGADEVFVAWGRPAGSPTSSTTMGSFAHVLQTTVAGAQTLADRTSESVMCVVSEKRLGGGLPATALSFYSGSADRQPLATFDLSFVDSNQDQPTMAEPLALAAGAFREASKTDIVVLGIDRTADANLPAAYRMWLLPAEGSAEFSPPIPGPPLPSDPTLPAGAGTALRTAVLTAAGDVDGDGIDEAVGAVPGGDMAELGYLFVGRAKVTPTAPFTYDSPQIVRIDRSVSSSGTLIVADADDDGARDVIILTGSESSARSIRVYWNDGKGAFASGRFLTVAGEDVSPQSFAWSSHGLHSGSQIAYVAATKVVVAALQDRAVAEEKIVQNYSPRVGTGIAAGDIDGDGVPDLAVADSGAVVILLGIPVVR